MKNEKKILIVCGWLFLAMSLPGFVVAQNVPANCTPFNTKQCISNIVYWYDSCGVLQSVYQNCNTTNQICQNGQCVAKATVQPPPPPPGPPVAPQPPPPPPPNNPIQNPSQSSSTQTQMSISFFVKKQADTVWSKTINASDNDKINFLIIIKNISDNSIDHVTLGSDVGNNISSFGDLKINNSSISGDVTSGIQVGSVGPHTSQLISFTGGVAPQLSQNVRITAGVSAGDTTYDSDYVLVNITPHVVSSTTTSNQKTSNSFLTTLLKTWYIWGGILLVLIVIFVIIFRRLSSRV